MNRLLKAAGYQKKECATDDEAKKYAAAMTYESDNYPVVYFQSEY